MTLPTTRRRTRRRSTTLAAVLFTATTTGLTTGLTALTSPAAHAATLVGSWEELVAAVDNGGTVDVTLTQDITGPMTTSLILPPGEHLILDLAGHRLTILGSPRTAAIQTTDAALTINDNQGTGSLTAETPFGHGAGIGGAYAASGGSVTINAGTVNADAEEGAGIGGGVYSAGGGSITINGGTVNAASFIGAGIGGGGFRGAGGTIVINGGTVNTTSGDGAGIGGGYAGDGGHITIKGGTVNAKSSSSAAAIGGGGGVGGGAGGTITIAGGNVTAMAGPYGTGIGSSTRGQVGTIDITGGTVTAVGGDTFGYSAGPGIGGGSGGSVSIQAPAHVTATSGYGSGLAIGSVSAPYTTVTNAGDLTLIGTQTLHAPLTNTSHLTVAATVTGTAGSIINDGTLLLAPGGSIAADSPVTKHNYLVSYDDGSLNPPPTQRVYAATYDDAQVTLPEPPTGHRWTSANSSGVEVTSSTHLPILFPVNADPTKDYGATHITLHAQPITPTYPWTGFSAPIDDGTVNTAKAGQGIPVNFTLGGDHGLDILADGSPTSRPVACDTTIGSDPIEQTVTAGGSGLSYDTTTDTYTYIWKTDKSWADTCRQLTLALDDGTTHTAIFQFSR